MQGYPDRSIPLHDEARSVDELRRLLYDVHFDRELTEGFGLKNVAGGPGQFRDSRPGRRRTACHNRHVDILHPSFDNITHLSVHNITHHPFTTSSTFLI